MGLVLIGWIGPKINGLDLRSGLGPKRLGKINGLDLRSGLGPKRLGWA